MEIIDLDIAIIGGGAAGLRAALAAVEHAGEPAKIGPGEQAHRALTIGLVSKVYPVRSHTVSAEGGIAGAMREYDSLEQHAFDTVRGSDYLADQDAVEFFVKEAPREIIQMEHWGCPWSREEDGKIAVRAFGGMSVKRTVYAADKTGFYMLHSLFERTLMYPNIQRFDEWFVTTLCKNDTRITGFMALELKTGRLACFRAKAVILAMGGAGKVFHFTTNGAIKTGDGMALAYELGVSLKDMEFIQFHPTGLPRTGILITEGARGEGGYLLNKNGERFMSRYLPSKMELGPRDIISRSIMTEIKAGRGFDGPYGSYVHLDIRHLGEKVINEKLPLVREVSIDFEGVDPVKEPIPVRPVAHYVMGGVDTDKEGKTELSGLFAAGETACVSINGANRLGSNSLAECLVFGAAAGKAAVEYARSATLQPVSEKEVDGEAARIQSILKHEGKYRLSDVREKLQRTMEEHVGIERTALGLEKAAAAIAELQQQAKDIHLQDRHTLFNTELTGYLELHNMLTVAEAMVKSAHRREESRGGHSRTDFPTRDDEKFLKHHLCKKTPSGMIFQEKPITITTWQPAERKY